MTSTILEIKGKRRSGKTFTTNMYLIGTAKLISSKKEAVVINSSKFTAENAIRNLIALCDVMKVKYKYYYEDYMITIGKLNISFMLEIPLLSRRDIIITDIDTKKGIQNILIETRF